MALSKKAAAQKAAMDVKIAKALKGFDVLATQLEGKGKNKLASMVDQARFQIEQEYAAHWKKAAKTAKTAPKTAQTLKEGQILKSEIRELKAIERDMRKEGKTAQADELRALRKQALADMEVIDDGATPETMDDMAAPEPDMAEGDDGTVDEEMADEPVEDMADTDPGLDDEMSENGDDVGQSGDVPAGTDLADKVASDLRSLQKKARSYIQAMDDAEADSEEPEDKDSEVQVSGDDDMSEDSEVPAMSKTAKTKETKAEKTGRKIRSALFDIAAQLEAEEKAAAKSTKAASATPKNEASIKAMIKQAKAEGKYSWARKLEALLG